MDMMHCFVLDKTERLKVMRHDVGSVSIRKDPVLITMSIEAGQSLINSLENVLNDFDVVEEAGGPNRAVVREFTGIRAGRDLKVAFEPSAHSPLKAALICGIEIVEESPSGVAGIH